MSNNLSTNESANDLATHAAPGTSSASEFAIVIGGLQSMVTAQGETQVRIAEINAKTETERVALERDRLQVQSTHGRSQVRNDFVIKLSVFLILGGVVFGGFYTGNHAIVTHAATLVVGMIAGAGLINRRQ